MSQGDLLRQIAARHKEAFPLDDWILRQEASLLDHYTDLWFKEERAAWAALAKADGS